MKNGRYNLWECGIRYNYYTMVHNPKSLKGYLALFGFLLFILPYALYYNLVNKQHPDLELF